MRLSVMGWTVPYVFEEGKEFVTEVGGLGVVGQLLTRLPFGKRVLDPRVVGAEQPDTSHRDVATAYLGLLAMGRPPTTISKAFDLCNSIVYRDKGHSVSALKRL
jgi:hypothetical protein